MAFPLITFFLLLSNSKLTLDIHSDELEDGGKASLRRLRLLPKREIFLTCRSCQFVRKAASCTNDTAKYVCNFMTMITKY